MLRPWPWGACWGSGLGPGVPAGDGVWRVLDVLEGLDGFGGCLEGLEGFGRFGGVWRVLEGVWRVWRVLERLESFGAFGVFAGWQTAALKANRKPLLWPWPWGACLRSGLGPGAAALKAHRKPLLWPWPWGACWGSGLGPGVPAGDGVWRVWTFFGAFGEFWSVCGLANGSFESQ